MNVPEFVVVHCSDSAWGNAAEIDRWHRARGFRCIGYHYVITNDRPTYTGRDESADGRVEPGRHEVEEGAHAPGYNTRSIGICLIGRGAYTDAQMDALHALVEARCRAYGIPADRVIGHCETASGAAQGKTCPLLDMDALRADVAARLAAHTPARVADSRSCTGGSTWKS